MINRLLKKNLKKKGKKGIGTKNKQTFIIITTSISYLSLLLKQQTIKIQTNSNLCL
jgi:hypothetical protein